VLKQIKSSGLKLKPEKCSLFKREANFLGHVVSQNGIATDPNKITQIVQWPVPTCIKQVRSIVGLASYYRRFVPAFAEICKPLYALTEKGAKFQWTETCQNAFDTLKHALTTSPILAYPREDCQYILDTDASDVGIGAVLSQVQDGEERVIAYASTVLNKHERRYCVTRKELYAVVKFVKQFKPYLYGKKFLIRTDHGSLRWLFNFKDPEGQIARWLEVLSEYDFEIQHRQGRSHQNADSLSRIICAQCPQCKRDNCPSDPIPKTEYPANGKQKIAKVTLSKDKPCGSSRMNWCRPFSLLLLWITTFLHFCWPSFSSSSPGPARSSPPVAVNKVGVTQARSNWLECLSAEELRKKQLDDPEIAPIIPLVEGGETPPRPPWKDISPFGELAKALWMSWEALVMRDGVLYIHPVSGLKKGISFSCSPLLVVPHALREVVLRMVHDGPTGGHLGITKTLARLQRAFYWVNMRQDVELWCRRCLSCAKRKSPGKKTRANLQQQLSGCPLERIALDYAGPLPETRSYNRYILVVTDYFTKYSEAYPVPDNKAITTARVLVNEFICRYGVPLQIHTDQGSQFESDLFQEVCLLLGIDKTRTSPFHPSSNGQVERMNRSIKDMLYHYLSDRQDDWNLHLPLVMMAYRSTPHESTKFSPNLLMFGSEVGCPESAVFDVPAVASRKEPCEYVSDLRDNLSLAHRIARENLGRSAEVQKRNYDHRSVPPPKYVPGDVVLLRQEAVRPGKNKKLSAHWSGPFLVVAVIGPVTMRIQKGPRVPSRVVHINRVKPFAGDFDKTWFAPTPLSATCEPIMVKPSSTFSEPKQLRKSKRFPRAPQRYGYD
jgi:hypothetical protein